VFALESEVEPQFEPATAVVRFPVQRRASDAMYCALLCTPLKRAVMRQPVSLQRDDTTRLII
jgi:hypothetical protein